MFIPQINHLSAVSGFSLVGSTIASGIFALLVVYGVDGYLKTMKAQRAAEIRGEVLDLRRFVRSNIYCQPTVANAGNFCRAEDYIAVYDKNGDEFIPRYPTVKNFGNKYQLRVKCREQRGEYVSILVQYRMVDFESGRVMKDPMSGKNMNWKYLLADFPLRCPIERADWFQATGQHCPTFCSNLGKVNVPSPDGYRCASGEILPVSAKRSGKVNWVYGCDRFNPGCGANHWWNSVNSVAGRCYGQNHTGPQPRDSDITDVTVGCYCQ